ncbi:MAG TPA: glycosyltransferase family 4 protein [Anaerolineae bacterium]|nr:glycosyltransferase family 4 protein [Anaerolineae bacterium]
MRIAWLVPGFSGDERDWCLPALLDLARALAARHDLHVFALQYPYRRDRYTVFGATVHAIGGRNRGRWHVPAVWRAALSQIAREHRRSRFDALHAFWAWEPGVIAGWLKQSIGVRTVISLAGGELIDLPEIGYGLGGRRGLLRVMRWALRRADVVTAGSAGLLARGRRLGLPAAQFAPLGVDVEMFSPEARQRETPPTIINVGSLEPVKGQADLLSAFRFVVDREPKARLVIAGNGSLKGELESFTRELGLAERVSFVGDVRHEELPALYHAAGVCVQASWHEAQGMAVLEAAACGLAIVGTPVGALADLAPEAAVTSPPGDPLRLAQALLSVLDDPARRKALGQAARRRVEDVYRLALAAERFETLYCET